MTKFLHVFGLIRDISMFAQVVVNVGLLLERGEGCGSLVQLFLFISKDFVMVGNTIAKVRIIVLLIRDLPLKEMLELCF
jgi:hypothetical protein